MYLIFLYHVDFGDNQDGNKLSFLHAAPTYEDIDPIVSLGLHLRCLGKLCCFTSSMQIPGVILSVLSGSYTWPAVAIAR